MARIVGAFEQFFDINGDPLVEGKLYFYASGSTTPKNTYADVAGTSVEKFKEILEAAGSRYASKDPAPWIEEAKSLA